MTTREKKFTPGPWSQITTHQCSSDAWYVVTDANGYGPIVDVGGKDKNGQIAEAKYLVTDKTEIQANANLIAAAPELLEALEELADIVCAIDVGLYEIDSFTLQPAIMAIAQAYGEES